MPCELSFNLSELVPQPHLYGNFNKELEFVAFCQSGSSSSDELLTLDFFNVTLQTRNGDLYTLNPILFQHMVLREEHFSNCLVLLGDMITDL